MPGQGELQYLVLSDGTSPYLLARVRWPDVCQAMSVGRPIWQDDQGLFDLPYDPSSTTVTLAEAIRIAATWGVHLSSDETALASGAALIRRMPADWSSLSPAEIRAWSIDFVKSRRSTTATTAEAEEGRVVAGTSRLGLGRWRRRRQAVSASANGSAVEPAELTSVQSVDSVSALELDVIDLRDSAPTTVPFVDDTAAP